MLDSLGLYGVVGVLVLVAGVGVVSFVNPILGAGVVLVLVGLGLTAWGLVTSALAAMGMDGMLG